MSNAVDFGRWVRRLIFNRSDEPDINFNVQPVLITGDHSNLTPRFQGPSIIFGATVVGVAAEHTVMVFRSLSPGGMIVHQLRVTLPGAGTWGIETDEPTWATGPTEMDRDMIGQPGAVTTGAFGSVDPGDRQLIPVEIYPYQTAFPLEMDHDLYIPNGRKLVVESVSANVAISGWASIEELPAPKGAVG